MPKKQAKKPIRKQRPLAQAKAQGIGVVNVFAQPARRRRAVKKQPKKESSAVDTSAPVKQWSPGGLYQAPVGYDTLLQQSMNRFTGGFSGSLVANESFLQPAQRQAPAVADEGPDEVIYLPRGLNIATIDQKVPGFRARFQTEVRNHGLPTGTQLRVLLALPNLSTEAQQYFRDAISRAMN